MISSVNAPWLPVRLEALQACRRLGLVPEDLQHHAPKRPGMPQEFYPKNGNIYIYIDRYIDMYI